MRENRWATQDQLTLIAVPTWPAWIKNKAVICKGQSTGSSEYTRTPKADGWLANGTLRDIPSGIFISFQSYHTFYKH